MDAKQLNVPENLHELLQRPEKKDFGVNLVYFLELSHGLMGFFPAVFANDMKRMVLTPDLLLLKAVWKTLSPRRAQIGQAYFAMNPASSIGYEIRGRDDDERKHSKPEQLLTQEEFDRLTADGQKPFRWAPGLIGDDMTAEEFRQTIELAQQQLREAF